MEIEITYIDTACVIININGFRIITDPALDNKTGFLPKLVGKPFIFSKKTMNPLLGELNTNIDLALISHDHHGDNLDNSGKKLLENVPTILSTKGAERRLQRLKVIGLNPWETYNVHTPLVKGLKITAVPAQHTNIKRLLYAVGHVIGFVIEWDNQENGALYISGDTVLFEGIYEISKKFKINTAILHLGAGAFPYLKPKLRVTMNAEEAIQTAEILSCEQVIPIHYEGWWHFKEPVQKMQNEINESSIKDKTIWLKRGVKQTIKL
ncbi:MBL fold metallo-hydrolase [Flavobacterium sp.]|uniref:MBL fold metallo-hydrolase n=1 Tax=Flavobacterium sp. TaxID=239 RepID=UPI00286D9DD4|nr:MBL fold metallo-hydrolase [Flavobacterium sp.]